MSPSTAMRRPLGPGLRVGKQRQRRAHRGGIGVVALVDQGDLAARDGDFFLRAASLWSLEAFEFRRGRIEVQAEDIGDEQNGQRIDGEMLARRADAKLQFKPEDVGGHDALAVLRLIREETRLRFRVFAEGEDMRHADRAGRLEEALEDVVVAIDDRDAAFEQAAEDLRLGVRDGLDGGEMLEMRRRDLGDDRDMRLHELHERGDLSRMVHAELEDAEARIRRHARQRQGHAPLIVVGRRRGVRRPEMREDLARHLLRRGLADRARDGGDIGGGARPPLQAQALERLLRVLHDVERSRAARELGSVRLVDDGRRRSALESRPHEVVPVERLALDRNEEIAGREAARIDRDAADAERQGAAGNARVQRANEGETAPERIIRHAMSSRFRPSALAMTS